MRIGSIGTRNSDFGTGILLEKPAEGKSLRAINRRERGSIRIDLWLLRLERSSREVWATRSNVTFNAFDDVFRNHSLSVRLMWPEHLFRSIGP